MRFFIRLSFDGSPFHGWQIQQNAHSVQQELNTALGIILRTKEIETTGCGRTDTGVHALKFFAHFDHEEIDAEAVKRQLNAILPGEIAIHSVFPVDEKSHARFDAVSRTYIYRIYHSKNPFLKNYSCFFAQKPDVERMNAFAALLLGKHDFSCFSKSNTQTKTNVCTVASATWRLSGEELIFEISADRFLRNMVRAIVGTLLNAGMHKLSEPDFLSILNSGSRSEAGTSVPAHGLYLSDVDYPFQVY